MNEIPPEYRIDVPSLAFIGQELPPARPSEAWIQDWVGSEAYEAEVAAFSEGPKHSLLSAHSRAFLFHLVRTLRPKRVLEVGTYFAGTAEVLARALRQNGVGTLVTTDPFGAERCPFIIRQWPAELQRHVEYHALNSMALAQRLGDQRAELDIAFIDGCHDYEYVLFDALTFAKLVRPGGVMVMDNAEQPGVFRATVEFLKQQPDWKELGRATQSDSGDKPFSLTLDRTSIRGTSFLVLAAPEYRSVAPRSFLSTGQIRHESGTFDAIRLGFFEAPTPGHLYAEMAFRAFGQTLPLEKRCLVDMRLGPDMGTDTLAMRLAEEMAIPAAELDQYGFITVEVGLYWNPDDGRSTLRLVGMPEAVKL